MIPSSAHTHRRARRLGLAALRGRFRALPQPSDSTTMTSQQSPTRPHENGRLQLANSGSGDESKLPLEGIRVVDLTKSWAGPLRRAIPWRFWRGDSQD